MVWFDSEIYAVSDLPYTSVRERYYRNTTVQGCINLGITKPVVGVNLPYTPFQQVHAETDLQIPKQDKKPVGHYIVRAVRTHLNNVYGAVDRVSCNERIPRFNVRICLLHLVFC